VPEGHTLHRLARDLAELVGPEVTATSPQGRFPAERVDGQRLNGVEAYGRPLLVDTAAGDSVHVHLGLRGKWLRFAPLTGPGLPQVRLRLAVPAVAWDLIAPSTCELLDAVDDGRIITVEATTGGRCPRPSRAGPQAGALL
jgi:formamidopyrimidine-DNA glycosylase